MKGRMVGLGFLATCELLAGIGLRNEALAARGRTEVYRRRMAAIQSRLIEHRAFHDRWVAPESVVLRLEERDQRRDAEVRRLAL